MMSPTLGERPLAGPEVTTLYCRPDGRVITPGALAFLARNSLPAIAAGDGAAFSCGGADGWTWADAAPAAARTAIAAIGAAPARKTERAKRRMRGLSGLG